jgi:galactokinase
MGTAAQLKDKLADRNARKPLARLYGIGAETLDQQTERYSRLLDAFAQHFPEAAPSPVGLFSAPGRAEIGGNHTDHNHGRVLAAAISLDTVAAAAPSDDNRILLHSEGYDQPVSVDLAELAPRGPERHTSNALVRGVAAAFKEAGHAIGGFRAAVASQVSVGSGLSSSAAFEVLIGTILSHFYNHGRLEPQQVAFAGQQAENFYFGKPSGLMDQMASAIGGFVSLDFQKPQEPTVKSIGFNIGSSGYVLVITNTGGSHANLTAEYAAVQREMQAVARALGGETLREVSRQALLEHVPALREKIGDRPILRALHYFAENERVLEQGAALEIGDTTRFLSLVRESGRSSWMLLQNCHVSGVTDQGVELGLALSETVLKGAGAWRVHGGGFAGTILAFVPNEALKNYVAQMEAVFGDGASTVVRVRPIGAVRLKLD